MHLFILEWDVPTASFFGTKVRGLNIKGLLGIFGICSEHAVDSQLIS